MRTTGSGARITLALRLSTVGFVALTGILAIGYLSVLDLFTPEGRRWLTPAHVPLMVTSWALPAIPGAVLSWWMLVVVPRRSSALAGGCAGLLTVILAVLGFGIAWLVYGGLSPTPLSPWQSVQAYLTFWLLGVLFLCIQPWGWGMLLVGGAAGALYGRLICRGLPAMQSGEAAPDTGLRPDENPDGSQDEESRLEREAN